MRPDNSRTITGFIPRLRSTYEFSGKERDAETGLDYFGARYYSSDLSIWLSVDPLADKRPSLSPYNYCQWSPVMKVDPTGMLDSEHIDETGNTIAHYDDGDKGVYVHKNGTTKTAIDNQRKENNNTGGTGKYIGNLGEVLDIGSCGIYSNKLAESTNQVLSEDFTFGDWFNNVKGGGIWDLKTNENTIWGIAWSYDMENETSTGFKTPNLFFEDASDFGNYHAGFTGSMFGVPVPFQKIGAGAVEQFKDLTSLNFMQVANQYFNGLKLKHNTFMDETDDYYWNTQGMSDALFLKKRLNLGPNNLLHIQKR
jgi:RHS repeat-associated protein